MKKHSVLIFFCALLAVGCSEYSPKPHAYPRVIYPEKEYELAETACPFQFEAPVYSTLNPYDNSNNCWYNLVYTPFDATLHLSYVPLHQKKAVLDSLTEDAYKMVFKPHLQRAEEIVEREISDTTKGIYGLIYDLEGKTATPFNFYITDGAHHFLRGSFYFNKKTNRDSVQAIYNFLNEDILHTIETFDFN